MKEFRRSSGPRALEVIAVGLLIVAGVAAGFGLVSGRSLTPVLAENERHPVLVELFTSEGCSSCPPADDLLAQLDAKQFVPGARAIVLSEHVTYWNHDGWRDPYSLESMTDRQQRYAQHFGLDDAYTPEAVVDGEAEFVGSDSRALIREVQKAAEVAKVALTIDHPERRGDTVHFAVRSGSPANPGDRLVAVVAEDAVQSQVGRGENAGRTLHHVAVVRVLKEMSANALDGRALELKLTAPESGGASTSRLRVVVFVKDARSGRVLGAEEQLIP